MSYLDDKLDIPLIIPTRNSMGGLDRHVETLLPWYGSVRQVVIVDSKSTDGSVEYLSEHLKHPNIKFIEHPPGLYASWNAAVSHADSTYVSFSTIGDTLPFESLRELYRIAESYEADVVISPPEILSSSGDRHQAVWPIHRFCQRLGSKEPYALSPLERVVWNTSALPGTLLGSSSSNLYKTSLLKETPFPCDYGHAGDSAWAVARPWTDRWVVAPSVKTCFIKHEASGRQRWGTVLSRPKLYRLAFESYKVFADSISDEHPNRALLGDVRSLLEQYIVKGELVAKWNEARSAALPWFLNPRALALRRLRKQLDLNMRKLSRDLCAKVTGSNNGG